MLSWHVRGRRTLLDKATRLWVPAFAGMTVLRLTKLFSLFFSSGVFSHLVTQLAPAR
jgi:hypothetical protein